MSRMGQEKERVLFRVASQGRRSTHFSSLETHPIKIREINAALQPR